MIVKGQGIGRARQGRWCVRVGTLWTVEKDPWKEATNAFAAQQKNRAAKQEDTPSRKSTGKTQRRPGQFAWAACTVESKTATLPLASGRDRDRGLPILCFPESQAQPLQGPEVNRTNHRRGRARRRSGSLSLDTWRLGTMHVLQEAKNF